MNEQFVNDNSYDEFCFNYKNNSLMNNDSRYPFFFNSIECDLCSDQNLNDCQELFNSENPLKGIEPEMVTVHDYDAFKFDVLL